MNLNRNSPCWCGTGKKLKQCGCPSLCQPGLDPKIRQLLRTHGVLLKNEQQIEGIRAACRLAVEILERTCERAVAGVSLKELNDFAHQLHLDAGARPGPLGYGSPPFPRSICLSVGEVVCHGIADGYVLREGDIVNIDVSPQLNGYFGDCSRMVCIGQLSDKAALVTQVSYECLMKAIERVRPGAYVCEIGEAIEAHAQARGCSVVDLFVGHGVGLHFHEGPEIPHHRNQLKVPLVPGMTFTIEPMINAGTREVVIDPIDRWTARTRDGQPSAQWEHTLLVTCDGVEILTPWRL